MNKGTMWMLAGAAVLFFYFKQQQTAQQNTASSAGLLGTGLTDVATAIDQGFALS